MENLIVEPEIFTQGETNVICLPFFQDPNFTVNKLPAADINHHKGEKFNLKLNPKFNSGIVLQPSEAMDQAFKLDTWNREVEKFVSDGMARDVARRVVLRKRFPLTVEVVDGVVYSKSQNVVCESLGKIPYMKQQLIAAGQVFVNSPQPQGLIRNSETARIAVQQSFNSEGDLSSHSQGKPLTRIPRSQPDDQVAGPSSQMWQAPKKRKWGVEPTAPVSHTALMAAVDTMQQFFNSDLMEIFNIPFDRAGKNITDVKPSPSSLSYSYSQYHKNTELRQTNTTKMGSYLFGDNKQNCSLFIYKTKNKYTGHNLPVSIREAGTMLKSFILTLIEALEKVAKNTLENEIKDAADLEGTDKQQALATAEENFAAKMARLRDAGQDFGHE